MKDLPADCDGLHMDMNCLSIVRLAVLTVVCAFGVLLQAQEPPPPPDDEPEPTPVFSVFAPGDTRVPHAPRPGRWWTFLRRSS